MTVTLTILGCGSSAGVPRPALGWGACDPGNSKNRRRRCSIMAERTSEQGTTRIVIDTAPDLHDIPDESWPALQNLDLWIVDGLRYAGHPSHFSVSDALSWIERFRPKRAVITNMHSDLDYEVLRKSLPADIVPAYDGMRLVLERV